MAKLSSIYSVYMVLQYHIKILISCIELEETPDTVCQQLGVCTSTCSVFPPPVIPFEKRMAKKEVQALIKPFPKDW